MGSINILNCHGFLSYLKAGFFLHVITLGELLLLWIVLSSVGTSAGDVMLAGVVDEFLLISFFVALPIFSQLDARSRYQNYKQLKDQLYLYGFDQRIFKIVRQSRCQRDAALAAAEALGYGEKCRAYFKTCGYQWYHIVPDFVFRKPHFFLSGAFWQKTFFMPTYRPKVHFET